MSSRVRQLVACAVSVLALVLLTACGPKTRECADGSLTTATGPGACSHHGGLKR